MFCERCKKVIIPDGTHFCYQCSIERQQIPSIFKKPTVIENKIFPNLDLKYLKGNSLEFNYISDYYRKYHFGDININTQYNEFCESLEGLKNNISNDIQIFFSLLKNIFSSEEFIIITIPSHNPKNNNTGIKRLAKLLIEHNKNIIDGTDILIRIKEINKHGQNRTLSEQYNSMILNKDISLKNKIILLFDDIYTIGNTINAAKKLIEKENIKNIEKLTLAKTFYKNK